MSASEKFNSINLKDIANISETEFKNQITTWIDEHGVSRALQSKLRADLFDQFNKTNLGRQMAIQHQQAHRLVLSPLILVLNTLVSEFLYAEDCHFTLSVFATEVPFKNTLPNFEATPKNQTFRFSDDELKDIFEAMGISSQVEFAARRLYQQNSDGTPELLNRSLLYCVLKNVLEFHAKNAAVDNKTQTDHAEDVNATQPQANACPNCLIAKTKPKKFEISSRYFKYLNRYLDILSDRVREMSKSLVEINSKNKSSKCSKSPADTSTIETNLKRNMEKIIENLGQITKSKQKSKKFRDILNSIDRLSSSLEKCGGNLESLLQITSASEKEHVTNSSHKPSEHVDYDEWLQQLRNSDYGRKFLDRLEVSLQKTIDKERDRLEKLYEEKLENYRILIKLHYKQKFIKNDHEMRPTPRGPEAFLRKVFTPNEENNMIKHPVKTSEKEHYVDQIVQSAKARLKQLELESEKLDESFQVYLKRQYNEKTQLNEDIAKIWENYQINRENFSQHVDPIIINTLPIPTIQTNQADEFNVMDKNSMNCALNILKDLNVAEFDKKIENPYLNFHPRSLIKDKSRSTGIKQSESKTVQCSFDGHDLVNGVNSDTNEKSVAQRRTRKKVKIITSSSESSDEKAIEGIKMNGLNKNFENGHLSIRAAKVQTEVTKTQNDEKSKLIKQLVAMETSTKINGQAKVPIVFLSTSPAKSVNVRQINTNKMEEILSNSSYLKDPPEFLKTNGNVNEKKSQTGHADLNQIDTVNANDRNMELNTEHLVQSEPDQENPPSTVLNNDLQKILERNTKNQFQKLTDFVLVSSSSDISDEKQQISTGLGRSSSPDDFWK